MELVQNFIKTTAVTLPYSFAQRRPGDVVKVWADPSKANEVLGWSAQTPIEDILLSAWNWEKKVRGIQ